MINVTAGPDIGLQEIQEVAQTISEKAGHDKANLLWGYIMEPELEGTISVSLVATDFQDEFLTNIDNSNTIRFAPSEEKSEIENDTKENLEENDYQEEDNYEKEEDDIDFVLPPFFEE